MSEKALSAEKLSRLISRLHAPDEAVRVYAAMRLTGSGVDAARVRPALEEALGDPDPHVRRLAAWVLARLGPGPRAAA